MKNVTPPVQPAPPRLWRKALLLLLSLLLVSAWAGCRSPQERYRVLSFFFDGVPDPDAPQATASGSAVAEQKSWSAAVNAPSKPMFSHPGFQDDVCSTCHDPVSRSLMAEPGKSPCLRCHQALTKQYPVMHGPVAIGECQLCHRAHDADNQKMLRTTGPGLCRDCHNELEGPPAQHEQAEADCLSCHVGHGSHRRFLLRSPTVGDAAAPAQPEEQPQS